MRNSRAPLISITAGPTTWLGDFWISTRDGLVAEINFGTPPPFHEGRFATYRHSTGRTDAPGDISHEPDDSLGQEVARQIVEFLAGNRRRFNVPLDWSVLPPAHGAMLRTLYEDVQWGDYVTYGELAAMAGYPGAARAAGTACRYNPFPLVVPAHRVIAAGHRIGGFLGRPDIKRRLLEREGSGPFRD